jgi:hypothetical protein
MNLNVFFKRESTTRTLGSIISLHSQGCEIDLMLWFEGRNIPSLHFIFELNDGLCFSCDQIYIYIIHSNNESL